MRRKVVRVRGLEFLLALELLLLRAPRGGHFIDEGFVRVVVLAEHVEERELPVLERVEVVRMGGAYLRRNEILRRFL